MRSHDKRRRRKHLQLRQDWPCTVKLDDVVAWEAFRQSASDLFARREGQVGSRGGVAVYSHLGTGHGVNRYGLHLGEKPGGCRHEMWKSCKPASVIGGHSFFCVLYRLRKSCEYFAFVLSQYSLIAYPMFSFSVGLFKPTACTPRFELSTCLRGPVYQIAHPVKFLSDRSFRGMSKFLHRFGKCPM